MHILIDTSSITAKRTGTGIYTQGLLKSLLMMPDINRIIAIGGEIDPDAMKHSEKLVHQFPGDTRWHYLLNNVWLGNRYNWEADIAFFPNYFMPHAFSIRSAVTIHDVSFLSHPECYSHRMRFWYTQRIKQTVSHAGLILTVSEPSRQNIIRYLGISGDKIHVIEPGSSLSGTDPHKVIRKSTRQKPGSGLPANGYKKFLYIGTIEPRKNILNMLRGFSAAKIPDLQLYLAGQIHCNAAYERAVRLLITSDKRIRYLGYLPDDQLQKELSRCDALVNLSSVEGFGLPVMEALLMGKECLISEDPALRELVGKRGISVHGDRVEEIAEGFERMSQGRHPVTGDVDGDLYSYYTWERFSRQLTLLIGRQPEIFRLPSPGNSSDPDRVKTLSGSPRVADAIVKALSYSAVFKCPLTPDQLYQRLPETECSFQVFMQALKRLCDEFPSLFRFDGHYVFLEPFDFGAARRDSDLVDNAIFISGHTNVIRWLNRLPWIKGIYYSGGTVHGSQLLKRDLDLFIIASKGRVWLLNSLLKGFAFVARKRNILCFNYLVDESALVIHHQRDLYTAHQLACLRPALPGRHMPEPVWYNQWIFEFFPNLHKMKEKPTEKVRTSSRWLYWINMIAMGLWTGLWVRKGLKNREGGILWDFHRIKLHTHDHRPFVYEKYQALLHEVMHRIRTLDKQTASSGHESDFITPTKKEGVSL